MSASKEQIARRAAELALSLSPVPIPEPAKALIVNSVIETLEAAQWKTDALAAADHASQDAAAEVTGLDEALAFFAEHGKAKP